MTARRIAFGAKPTAADWVREGDGQAPAETLTGAPAPKAALYTARLTIDVTPALRGRIKLAAFKRDLTVADLLRTLLERAFPPEDDGQTDDREARR